MKLDTARRLLEHGDLRANQEGLIDLALELQRGAFEHVQRAIDAAERHDYEPLREILKLAEAGRLRTQGAPTQ